LSLKCYNNRTQELRSTTISMTIELSWCHIRAVKQIDRYNRRDNSFVIFLLFFKRKKLNRIVLECINPFCSYAAVSLLFHGISPKLAERRCRTRRKHFIGETSSAFNVTIVFLTSRKSRQGSLSGIAHRFRETRFGDNVVIFWHLFFSRKTCEWVYNELIESRHQSCITSHT